MTNNEEFIKILETVPQKYEDFGTITYQMKNDVFNYFKDENLTCIEIGCYKGYTTNIFSNVFREIIGLDCNQESLASATNNNKKNKNVSFIELNLYDKSQWRERVHEPYKDKIDVSFVDASHSYEACKADIIKSIELGCKYIIVDDLGVYDDIKTVLIEIVEEYKSSLKSIDYIGVDWKHYKLPVLNFLTFCLRHDELNFGVSQINPTWILRDKTDILLNGGKNVKKVYDPININLQIVSNYAAVVSGHVVNSLKKSNPNTIRHVISKNGRIDFCGEKEQIPEHTFTPFPTHRFSPEEMNSMINDGDFFEKDDNNFEGVILEFNHI